MSTDRLTPRHIRRHEELEKATFHIIQTSNKVGEAIQAWRESSTALSDIGPSMEKVNAELNVIRKELEKSHKEHSAKMEEYKKKQEQAMKKGINNRIPNKIKGWVEEETEKQVAINFDRKLSSIFPVPIEQQSKDLDKHTASVKALLANSHARTYNATLTLHTGLHTAIEPLAMPGTHTTSKLFPGNLQSLLYYSDDDMKHLCADYGLAVHDSKAINLNRFLNHIGIRNIQIPPHILAAAKR